MCAGPYSIQLLGISAADSQLLETALLDKIEVCMSDCVWSNVIVFTRVSGASTRLYSPVSALLDVRTGDRLRGECSEVRGGSRTQVFIGVSVLYFNHTILVFLLIRT